MPKWRLALGVGLLLVGLGVLFTNVFHGRPGPSALGRSGFRPGAMTGGGMMGGGIMGGGMMGHGPGVGQGGAVKTSFASNGERIYYTATSRRTGPIPYQGGPMWLSMHGGACVSCHGEGGRGGVPVMMVGKIPPDITYAHLTGAHHHDGDHADHPPYTDELIKRAITQGINPAGERLSQDMPRWQLSDQDFADLLAYLKTLGPGAADGQAAGGHEGHEMAGGHEGHGAAGGHEGHGAAGGHTDHDGMVHSMTAPVDEKPAWPTLAAFLGVWGVAIGTGRYARRAGHGKLSQPTRGK